MKKRKPLRHHGSTPARRIEISAPVLKAQFLAEPPLGFCGGREHVSPQKGIAIFGPRSLDLPRHPLTISLSFVGTGQSIQSAQNWIKSCAEGVKGNGDDPDFPGFKNDRGFFSELQIDPGLNEVITTHDLTSVEQPRLLRDRFSAALDLVSQKLRLLSERDNPPTYVVLALPDSLLAECKTVDYTDTSLGQVHRDFRRAMKAEAMKYRLPTQILLQRTSEAGPESKKVDHRAKCAWNFFTGMYFKCGGIPWTPRQLTPGTCYIGISFFRSLGSKSQQMRSSVAQAFDEHGDGIVLRGQDFLWDEEKHGKSPHLGDTMANELVAMVLRRYEAEMQQKPTRVVIHKSSRFWPDEKMGFENALKQVQQFDLLAVNPTSQTRLLRTGQYPPLRGTSFQAGDTHYLYTTGFIPALNGYPHGHVPSPLQVADHFGDSSIETLLREILTLTKMNWNSASFAGLMPITLRFSRLVGDIMREIPMAQDRDPLPQFRYYI
jgi:hypothetical protein